MLIRDLLGFMSTSGWLGSSGLDNPLRCLAQRISWWFPFLCHPPKKRQLQRKDELPMSGFAFCTNTPRCPLGGQMVVTGFASDHVAGEGDLNRFPKWGSGSKSPNPATKGKHEDTKHFPWSQTLNSKP